VIGKSLEIFTSKSHFAFSFRPEHYSTDHFGCQDVRSR
jgi:hypothetical protein